MKASEIYLKAAEEVARSNQESCLAIADAGYGPGRYCYDNYPEPGRFTKMFSPTIRHQNAYWLNGHLRGDDEFHSWRVLALLFMHQIAKDEESK